MSNFLMKMKFFKGKKSMNLCQNEIPPKLVFITKKNPESWEKFHSLSNEKLFVRKGQTEFFIWLKKTWIN